MGSEVRSDQQLDPRVPRTRRRASTRSGAAGHDQLRIALRAGAGRWAFGRLRSCRWRVSRAPTSPTSSSPSSAQIPANARAGLLLSARRSSGIIASTVGFRFPSWERACRSSTLRRPLRTTSERPAGMTERDRSGHHPVTRRGSVVAQGVAWMTRGLTECHDSWTLLLSTSQHGATLLLRPGPITRGARPSRTAAAQVIDCSRCAGAPRALRNAAATSRVSTSAPSG